VLTDLNIKKLDEIDTQQDAYYKSYDNESWTIRQIDESALISTEMCCMMFTADNPFRTLKGMNQCDRTV
jgi:hypothetical protein